MKSGGIPEPQQNTTHIFHSVSFIADPTQQPEVLCTGGAWLEVTQLCLPCLSSSVRSWEDGRFWCENINLSQSSPCIWRRSQFPPVATRSRTDCILLLLVALFVPGEALLVEGYYYLRTFVVGLLGEHQVSLL